MSLNNFSHRFCSFFQQKTLDTDCQYLLSTAKQGDNVHGSIHPVVCLSVWTFLSCRFVTYFTVLLISKIDTELFKVLQI